MKCCGNCEWCITEEEELAQIKEKNYDEEDLNRPLTGDCSLGIDHGENYCCSQHNYMEKLTNIYVLYDENYFGPGYFIVTEYNKEKSSIHISITEDYADITISKDIVSDKDNKDSINITLGDPYTCKNYIQLSTFYNRLAKLSKGVLKEEGMKKILKIK